MNEITLPPHLTSPFPAFGRRGMAVCDHPLAAQAACDVLDAGGNAVDAAVALSMTLGATCPHYTGLGGGGFALVWMPGMTSPRCLDYREVALLAAHPRMYEGRPGKPTLEGGLSVGVPGLVRGLATLRDELGKIPWARLLEPAIEAAERGTRVDPNFERIATLMQSDLARFPEIARMILRPDGGVPASGDPFSLPDLARTLRALAEHGPDELYRGELSQRILSAVRDHGGLMTELDLADYTPVWRSCLEGSYRDHKVYTVGPPSAGGIQLLQMLTYLEQFPISKGTMGSVADLHCQAEAMKLSFFERASLVADPAFVDVPLDWLLDPVRLRTSARRFSASGVMQLTGCPRSWGQPVASTAAYVVAAADGSFVSATESINHWYGSLVVPPGAGFALNNIMDDFSCNPGQPDSFGIVSSEINRVEPGKRATSSVAPSLVFRGERPWLAVGSAGGPRIPTAVLQIISNLVDYGLNVQQAMNAPRIHHQWCPDVLYVEPQLGPPARAGLGMLGHTVDLGPCRSHACVLMHDQERFMGGSDFRSVGAALGL